MGEQAVRSGVPRRRCRHVRQRMLIRYVGQVEGGRDLLAKAQALYYPTRDKRNFTPTAPTIDTTGTPYSRHGVR